MRKVLLGIAISLTGGWLSGQTQSAGDIVGQVVTTQGKPVGHASVVAIMNGKAGQAPALRHGMTDGLGKYTISGVPLGTNTICVSAPGYLNPCRWGQATTVSFQGNQVEVNLIIAEGRRIDVAVRDSAGLLPSAGFNTGVSVQLTYQDGTAEPLPLLLRSGPYVVFSGLLPPGTTATVKAYGPGLELTGAGQPGGSTVSTTVVAPASHPAASLVVPLPFGKGSGSQPDVRVDFSVVGRLVQ